MDRIKGSAIAKVIAWLLLMVSAVVCIGSFLVMIAMEDYGVFRQKKEKTIEEEWSYISENYAVRAVDHYRNGLTENNEKYFNKDRAFYYGIIETGSLDDVDLNDENSYSERNFTGHINQKEMQDFDFGFDNVTRKYKNYDLLNDISEHKIYENRDMDITATMEMPQMEEVWLDE